MDPQQGRFCKDCVEKAQRMLHGMVFLVVEPADDIKKGTHFKKDDFLSTLRLGFWPEGLVVEKWNRGTCSGVFMVQGIKLQKLDQGPVGDDVWLTPERKPSPRVYQT
jgi:hypothetical protein